MFISSLLFLSLVSTTIAGIPISGNIANDLTAGGNPVAEIFEDANDVALPAEFANTVVSGFDIRAVYFSYDSADDELFVGIQCFGVCGDADGDGVQGRTNTTLAGLGGVDNADLGNNDALLIALDFTGDVPSVLPTDDVTTDIPYDIAIGVPTGGNIAGIYTYANDATWTNRFGAAVDAAAVGSVILQSEATATETPDIEFIVTKFSALYELVSGSALETPFTLPAAVWFGSSDDATIGDDVVPSALDFLNVQLDANVEDQETTEAPETTTTEAETTEAPETIAETTEAPETETTEAPETETTEAPETETTEAPETETTEAPETIAETTEAPETIAETTEAPETETETTEAPETVVDIAPVITETPEIPPAGEDALTEPQVTVPVLPKANDDGSFFSGFIFLIIAFVLCLLCLLVAYFVTRNSGDVGGMTLSA